MFSTIIDTTNSLVWAVPLVILLLGAGLWFTIRTVVLQVRCIPDMLRQLARGEASPDGNTVSLEDEMMRAAEAKRQFALSLAVVQSGMPLLRTAAGRRG